MRLLPIAAVSAVVLGSAVVSCTQASSFPKDSPPFVRSYDAALSAAKQSGKPIVVVFSASWCPPCQENKAQVYPNSAVKPFHDQFVWAYLDADEGANLRVMAKYKVDSIPHIQFLTPSGSPLGSVIGSTSPQEFAAKLTRALKKSEASRTPAP